MQFQDSGFSTIRGSDVVRDGMFLELYAGREPNGAPLAEYFYSDATRAMTLTLYVSPIAEEVLQWFECEAQHQLPPLRTENSES